MIRRTLSRSSRRGAVALLTAVFMVILLGVVAFVVDIGYIAVAKNEAQNAADAAALAGMAKLAERLKAAPISQGVPVQTTSDLDLARAEAKAFAARNRIGGRASDVRDADVEFGYLANPHDQTSNTLDTTGWPDRPYNAVRVTVRRDSDRGGGPLDLFFAPVLGTSRANVRASATAAVVMGTVVPRGDWGSVNGGLLPFAYQVDQWNALLTASAAGPILAANDVTINVSDNFQVNAQSSNSDGVRSGSDGTFETPMFPDNTTAGNYGTVNFSRSKVSNSTSVLRDIIENGPNVVDWPDLPDILWATPSAPVDINGDPGLSVGMESAVEAIVGQTRIIPLYSTVSGTGNNTFYRIVGFVPVTIVDVDLHGGTKHITIQPRVASYKGKFDGTNPQYFDVTPSATPNVLFLGARALVR